ncbi:CRISPR-associated endonuclease/helicase Cas3 [Gammaproteobacteria bacterium]
MFIAHLDGDRKHELATHLIETAALARNFAETFGAGDWAELIGLWHDLGKYRPAFQQYIDPDAHIEGVKQRVDHSTSGALHAVRQFKKIGRLLAYLIAGHHAGLPDLREGEAALLSRLDNADKKGYLDEIPFHNMPEILRTANLPKSQPPGRNGEEKNRGIHLWLRLLFSCLVDADFLNTEAFMDPNKAAIRQGFASLEEMRSRFNHYITALAGRSATTPVNKIRAEVLGHCRLMAHEAPGCFSLTVPTGGGKTLASLGFALEHALLHEKRRIIYVIPYTSIIEQTADVFREVFQDLGEAVVEHHASADANPENETRKSRLACENWDAPLIVTTSVQFFESLFAARTSRCRKLHNIVNSVVILDEAQLIPPEFRQLIVDMLRLLTDYYGVTLLLCTATQPALGSVSSFQERFHGLDKIREIIADPHDLYRRLQRVKISLPADLNQSISWPTLAEELSTHHSVLCVVNRRGDCKELHGLMPSGTIHLSALMCGAHRSEVIATIKAQLNRQESTRVISTQLVEAGVDLDFPVVYRALAGLDSIAQSAGRCNREGKLPGLGEVRVFVPPTKNPGIIRKAEDSTRELLHGFDGDLLEPKRFTEFFRLFYAKVDSDKKNLAELLYPDNDLAISFRTVAENFRLMDDSYQRPIFVGYGEEGWHLIDQLRHMGPERWLMRKLQRYAVNVNKNDLARLCQEGFVEELQTGILVQREPELYDETLGVLLEPSRRVENFIF